jgi:hypothetical protein
MVCWFTVPGVSGMWMNFPFRLLRNSPSDHYIKQPSERLVLRVKPFCQQGMCTLLEEIATRVASVGVAHCRVITPAWRLQFIQPRKFSAHSTKIANICDFHIALGYGLDGRGSRVRFPAGTGNFSLHHRVQNGSGAHPASYPIGIKAVSLGVKRPGSEADHLMSRSKNAWSYTSTPQYSFVAWCSWKNTGTTLPFTKIGLPVCKYFGNFYGMF